jgi:hypothetical protein
MRRACSCCVRAAARQIASASTLPPCCGTQVLPETGPADVTQAWLALSRLALPPPPALRGPLLVRTGRLLPALRPRGFIAVLHSLARLDLDPGPAWWAAAAPQLAQSALPAASPQGLSLTAWALGRLRPGAALGPAALQQLLASSLVVLQRQVAPGGADGASGVGRGFSAPELAALAWGLGRAGVRASDAWVDAYVAAAGAMWEDWTSGELAMVLSGLSKLRGCGGGSTAASTGDRSDGCGKAAGSSSECSGASGGGGDAVSGRSSPVWGRAALEASQRAMAGAPTNEITALAVGAARLGLLPGPAWVATLEDALVEDLGGGAGRRPAADGRLRVHQQQHAMKAEERVEQLQQQPWAQEQQGQQERANRQQQQAEEEERQQRWRPRPSTKVVQPRDAALLLWAVARLGASPSPRMARVLLQAAAGAADGMNGQDAAMALWGVSQLWLPAARAEAATRSSGSRGSAQNTVRGSGVGGPRAPPEAVTDMVNAVLDGQCDRLAHRRPHPGPAAGAAAAPAPAAARLLAEARGAAVALCALRRLGHAPEPAWVDAAWRGALGPALPALAAHSPGVLAAALRALRRLRAAPRADAQWLDAVRAAAAPRLAAWPPATAAAVVREVARLEGWSGSAWLGAACGALGRSTLGALSVRELAGVVVALARAGELPDAGWAPAALRELRRRADAGECGGDEGCEVRQHEALCAAAAMCATPAGQSGRF